MEKKNAWIAFMTQVSGAVKLGLDANKAICMMTSILTPLHNINGQNVMANKFILGRLGENQPYKVLM